MRFNFWQKNLGRSYWQTGVIPALVSFFLVSGPILSTWACFWVPRPSDGKKPITYSDTEFYSESSGKKFFPKISRHKKARATSKRVFEHILAADWKSLFCFVYISKTPLSLWGACPFPHIDQNESQMVKEDRIANWNLVAFLKLFLFEVETF